MRHGLAFVPAEDCFATPFPDARWFGVARISNEHRPRSQPSPKGCRKLARMSEASAAMRRIFSPCSAARCRRATPHRLCAWRARAALDHRHAAKLLVSSPRAFLDANFESDKIKATLAAWGMHLDFAPDIAGGALFPYLEAMADQSFGMALGKGGADVMIKAMTAYLKELGGELHLDSEVARIKVEGRARERHRLADGRSFEASARGHRQCRAADRLRKTSCRRAAAMRKPSACESFRPGPAR